MQKQQIRFWSRDQSVIRRFPFLGVIMITAFVLFWGCAGRKKNARLEEVAKDWCMTIRASQVIPVYPLTEDLQPGDIFLVQVPVDKQHEIYRDKGFLALDNHLLRLKIDRYPEFYSESFVDSEHEDRLALPRDWLNLENDEEAWKVAPDAAFPSYGFSIKGGGGFNLAIPVQGIPVGLSLMGADAADGTINISKATTYGIDITSLYDLLTNDLDHMDGFKSILGFYPSNGEKKNYIRVVNRIYLAKKLDISMRDSNAISAGLDAGLPRPVNLVVPKTSDNPEEVTAEKYSENIKAINESLTGSLEHLDSAGKLIPGGSLRVTSVSAGAISLEEEFERPLVIGYLGFDMEILDDGSLGPPIPTHAILSGDVTPGSLTFTKKENMYRNKIEMVMNGSKEVKLKFVESLEGPAESIYNRASAESKNDILTKLIQIYYFSEDEDFRRKLDRALDKALTD